MEGTSLKAGEGKVEGAEAAAPIDISIYSIIDREKVSSSIYLLGSQISH